MNLFLRSHPTVSIVMYRGLTTTGTQKVYQSNVFQNHMKSLFSDRIDFRRKLNINDYFLSLGSTQRISRSSQIFSSVPLSIWILFFQRPLSFKNIPLASAIVRFDML